MPNFNDRIAELTQRQQTGATNSNEVSDESIENFEQALAQAEADSSYLLGSQIPNWQQERLGIRTFRRWESKDGLKSGLSITFSPPGTCGTSCFPSTAWNVLQKTRTVCVMGDTHSVTKIAAATHRLAAIPTATDWENWRSLYNMVPWDSNRDFQDLLGLISHFQNERNYATRTLAGIDFTPDTDTAMGTANQNRNNNDDQLQRELQARDRELADMRENMRLLMQAQVQLQQTLADQSAGQQRLQETILQQSNQSAQLQRNLQFTLHQQSQQAQHHQSSLESTLQRELEQREEAWQQELRRKETEWEAQRQELLRQHPRMGTPPPFPAMEPNIPLFGLPTDSQATPTMPEDSGTQPTQQGARVEGDTAAANPQTIDVSTPVNSDDDKESKTADNKGAQRTKRAGRRVQRVVEALETGTGSPDRSRQRIAGGG